jgi:hypothetical protein
MIKKEIMAIIFFGTSFTLLLGGERKLEELKLVTCQPKQIELSFNEIMFKSELEIFDEVVSGENFEGTVTADKVDNVELERSGGIFSLLLLRTEKPTPDSGIEIELQGAGKFTVSCLEDSCSVKAAIKRKRTLQKELLQNGGGASRGSFYSYCFVCNVWFLYYDKDGRHKRRKAFCNGYCLRKSEY